MTESASTNVNAPLNPPPGDRELIGVADRLGEPGEAKHWKDQEQHGEPGGERRDYEDGHENDVA